MNTPTQPHRAPRHCFLDFETTGFDPVDSEIIEIGAVVADGLTEVARFSTLVRPIADIPQVIQDLTGITDEMVRTAPLLADAAGKFEAFLATHFPDAARRAFFFSAHNARMEERFCETILYPLLSEPYRVPIHNTIEPLALVFPEASGHSMEALRKWAGLSLESSHRALADCTDCLEILVRAREFALRDRPELFPWIRAMLGGREGALPWAWAWYFRQELDGDREEPAPDAAIRTASLLLRSRSRPEEDVDLREARRREEAAIDSPPPAPELDAAQVHEAFDRGTRELGLAPRAQQLEMADTIARALSKGRRVAIEAPTGTGKSLAYLVPGALAARQTGFPVVVATHSKALQDQLLEKDLPRLRQLLEDGSLNATTVKGQENYVCLRKLFELVEAGSGPDISLDERWSTAFLVAFTAFSDTGELDRINPYIRGEFASMPEQTDWARSHYTTTQGPPCPHYRQCRFFAGARRAHSSAIVIANHALVTSWPAHLPQIREVIFDEAHHLEEQLTEALSVRLSESAVSETLERLSRKRGGMGRGPSGRNDIDHLSARFPDLDRDRLQEQVTRVRQRLTQLQALIPLALPRDDFGGGGGGGGGYETPIDLSSVERASRGVQAAFEGFRNLSIALEELYRLFEEALKSAEERKKEREIPAEDFDSLKFHAYRLESQSQKLRTLVADEALARLAESAKTVPLESAPDDLPTTLEGATARSAAADNWLKLLHWDPRAQTWRIQISPIEVAPLSAPFFAPRRSVVLTSATLSAGTRTDFLTGRVGLDLDEPMVVLPSPYRLERQARVFIPRNVSVPGTSAHFEALISFAEQTARLLGGRTLLLMSANRRLSLAAERLRPRLALDGIEVIDGVSDRRAAETFIASERALLIGGERYGEGLDIPGRKLACVILEKINESMTRGPLAEARKKRVRNSLFDFDFPLRMIWLKQRAGRLIRSPDDRGAIVVFDPRFHGWKEASREQVLKTLAPIPLEIADPDGILEAIRGMNI